METDTSTSTSTNGPVILAVCAAILAVLIAVFALGKALATPIGGVAVASADDGDASDAPAATSATASLSEFAIDLSETTLAADATIEVTNDGAAPHNLALAGTDLTTADLNGGESDTLSLGGLDAGTYTVLCTIAGHEAAGMSTEVTVVSSDRATAGSAGQSDHDAHGEGADWEAVTANMRASVEAFPAETDGTGGELLEPTILEDGTKEYRLVADEVEWEVEPDKVVDAMAYNGQIPGPTMQVDVGDRVRIIIENQLDEITSLHPHGVIGVTFDADGVGFVSQEPIPPGETFVHEFVAEELSVGMYHAHDMGLHQVPNGLAGTLLVGQVPVPDDVEIVRETSMILNDAGNIGFALNGKSFPATEPYALAQGEAMLVHYMNEGLASHPMHLHGNRQLVVAKDGFPLESPYYADTVNVAPGERYSVVVEAEKPGVWVWHCHIFNHVERPDGTMFGMLTALIVE